MSSQHWPVVNATKIKKKKKRTMNEKTIMKSAATK